MCNQKLVIFDLDDTLIDTSNVYWKSRSSFVEIISEELLIEKNILIAEFEKFDSININILGFSPYRYEKSMVDTYKYICQKINRRPSKKTILSIRTCGSLIRKEVPNLISGAKDILEWTSQNHITGLITRGEYSWQMQKIHSLKIDKYFKFIRVVDNKNVAVFKEAIQDTGQLIQNTWIIGDSVKSDINPGIKLGANCILYTYTHPHYYWEQDYEPCDADNFYKVNKLENIKQAIESQLSIQHDLVPLK